MEVNYRRLDFSTLSVTLCFGNKSMWDHAAIFPFKNIAAVCGQQQNKTDALSECGTQASDWLYNLGVASL